MSAHVMRPVRCIEFRRHAGSLRGRRDAPQSHPRWNVGIARLHIEAPSLVPTTSCWAPDIVQLALRRKRIAEPRFPDLLCNTSQC